MIIKATLIGLVVILIVVIAMSYYSNKEGFDNITAAATPKVVVDTKVNDIFLDIIANTTDGSTIRGVKIVYNSTVPVLSAGQSTDSVLAFDLVVPATPFTIYNKLLSSLQNGFKYYLVTSDVNSYVEGTTPLLGSFVFNQGGAGPSGANPIPANGTPTVQPIPANGTPTVQPIPANGTPTVQPIPATGTPTIQPIPASGSVPSATPARVDIVPEVTISGVGYDALTLQQRADLLRDIQKTVRNDILANRAMKPIISGETRQSKDTDATAQGQEYESSCHKDTEYRCPKNPDGSCPPLPDMSEYIKKDAIPCWGCSLDY